MKKTVWIISAIMILVLAGCYIPEKFDAKIDVNEDGSYTMTYDGTMVNAMTLGHHLSPKDDIGLKEDAVEIGKDPEIKDIEYIGRGRYKLSQEVHKKAGQRGYLFGKDIKVISVIPRKDGSIRIFVDSLEPKEIQELKSYGMKIDGKLVISVPKGMKITGSNADRTPSVFGLFGDYEWDINSFEKKIDIVLEPESSAGGDIGALGGDRNMVSNNKSAIAKSDRRNTVQNRVNSTDPNRNRSLCSADENIVFSCDIKKKILSVCKKTNNNYIYRNGTSQAIDLEIKTRPLYSHTQFAGANEESHLRFQNGEYDCIVYSNVMMEYDKNPYDGTQREVSHSGVYVSKNNKLLAKLQCDKTYIDNLNSENFQKEKYVMQDESQLHKDVENESTLNKSVNDGYSTPSPLPARDQYSNPQRQESGANTVSFQSQTSTTYDLAQKKAEPIHKLVRTFEGHKDTVASIAISPDGTMIASGSYDGIIILWDVQTDKRIRAFHKKGMKLDQALSIAFSPDGTKLVTGHWNWYINIWDVNSGELLNSISSGTGVCSVAYSPDGTMIASGDYDSGVGLWNARNGRLIESLTGHADCVDVAFSPDGTMIASTGGEDTSVKLWDVQSGKLLKTIEDDKYNQGIVVFSPDGTTIAIGGGGGFIKLIDVKSGEVLKKIKSDKAAVTSIAFSPDGNMLASTGGSERIIKLWDAQGGRLLDTIKGNKLYFRDIAFSPDGSKMASGYGNKIKLWDISSSAKLLPNTSHIPISKQKSLSIQNEIPGKDSDKKLPVADKDGPKIYYAKITERDHYGARGQKLKDPAAILQQDRAIFYKYYTGDREDTGIGYFATRKNRNKLRRMLARGSTSQKTLDAIRYGTPFVKVAIYQNNIDVSLVSEGSQSRQKQHRKAKSNRCNTTGYIRGISRNGDGFVAVRKGPGTGHRMINKIYRNGTKVRICDRKGKWKGIVYGDCIEDSSRSHNGSCVTGWVYGKYVR